MVKPTVTTTNKPLPFGELSPLDFERMCLWLVEREGYLRPEHLGETGNEQGRDIVAYRPVASGEELWYFQCKRHKRIGATTLKREVDKYNDLATSNPAMRPSGVVFVTSSTVSSKVREEVAEYCHQYGYAHEFWARTELDMRVKKFRDIVSEFFYTSSSPDETSLHQIPPPPRDFTGRSDEITEILSIFGRSDTNIVCLHGMGGIGKTSLALKVAEHLKQHYPDAQFYIDLKGASHEPISPADVMLHVIRAYDPTAEFPKGEAELSARYLSVLHDQRALILLDNAANREQLEPLMPPDGCALLVTSRRRFHLAGQFAKNIQVMSPKDARALLLTIAPRIGEHADTIARLCGRLPLALLHAARNITERPDLWVTDYIKRIEKTQQRLEPINASLNLSYELLPEEMRSKWRNLAVFPDAFDYAAAITVWKLNSDEAKDILSELVKHNLLEWDETNARYRMHDLLRLFADEHLDESERYKAQKHHATHYLRVLGVANYLYQQKGEALKFGLLLFDLEWTNIRVGQSWAEKYTLSDDEAAYLCNQYPTSGALLLHVRRHPRERIRWWEVALAANRRLGERAMEGVCLGNIGMTYLDLGDAQRAIEFHEQALAVFQETGDLHGQAQGLGNLGNAYASLSKYDRGVRYYEQQLTILREMGDRHSEGLTLGNLGIICASTGEYRRAIEYYEEALKVIREVNDRLSECELLGNIGVLYAELGEIHRAIELHQQAFLISHEIGDLVNEGQSLGNLGWALASLGDNQRGIKCHERQLSLAREVGDPHSEGNALHGLGVIHAKLGERPRAVEHFKKALKMFRETGCRHDEERTLGDLGTVYLRSEDYQQAIKCYEQQLLIAREVGDRRGEAVSIWNTAWAFSKLGDLTQAIAHGESAIKIYEEIEDLNQLSKSRKYMARWRGKI